MKIGIMTFWWSQDNYGQILQCYALQKYLRDRGHDAYLIRYDPRKDYVPTPLPIKLLKACNPVKFYFYIKTKRKQKKTAMEQQNNPRFFDDFRNTYIKQSEKIYYSWQDLKENPPEADMYVVGSDQVWNFGNIPVYRFYGVIHAYFLDFGAASVKRVAYAASWGMESLRDDIVFEVKPLMQKFDYISVREKKGLDLCVQCGYNHAEWVFDPTLLFDTFMYRTLYSEHLFKKPIRKYLFLYMLNNPYDFNIKTVYEWGKQRNLEIIYVTGNDTVNILKKCYATIPQWLYLIDNAEYIVTNSFHCCIFSVLFKKQFGVIPLTKHCTGMNSRITSLFETSQIPERFITCNDLRVLDEPYESQQACSKVSFINISEWLNSIIMFGNKMNKPS